MVQSFILIDFLLIMFYPSVTYSLEVSKYWCGDPRWRLQTADPNWNMNISLWTLTNVFLRPGNHPDICPGCVERRVAPWFYINASVVLDKTREQTEQALEGIYSSAMECTKNIRYSNPNNSREPVFFNFPCANAAHWRWIGDHPDIFQPPSNLNTYYKEIDREDDINSKQYQIRDLLIVYNSWSATSFYHVMIETVFPLFITIKKAKDDMGYTMDNMTLLNLSPSQCNDEPHLYTVRPILEHLYGSVIVAGSSAIGWPYGKVYPQERRGKGFLGFSPNLGFVWSLAFGAATGMRIHPKCIYEDTWGGVSGTFSHEKPTLYRNMIYGFHYPLRPYRDHILTFNKELGAIFRDFRSFVREAYGRGDGQGIPPAPSLLSGGLSPRSSPNITLIHRLEYNVKRNFANITAIQEAFLRVGNISANVVSFGKGPLSSIMDQARYSAEVDVLIGAEGAGFVQQLFMPLNSLLILIHTPRYPRDQCGHIEGNEWHEAVGQYLDNSIVNIVTPSLAEISQYQINRIAVVARMAIEMHLQMKSKGKAFTCTVRPVDEPWTVEEGCQGYRERSFFDRLP